MHYGISVPDYFLVTFAIMLPLKLGGKDFDTIWAVGVAWCFVHAIVATIGAFVGPTMQKLTPRAAMLGTLAGVAITYIAMGAAFNAWNVAWLSMVSFGIIFVGWLANVQFPGKIPAGLVAVILGIVFGYWGIGDTVFHLLLFQTFATMKEQTLAQVPLFVFMGLLLERAGLMERLFLVMQKMLGGLNGALYLSAMFVATLFGAASGIVGASVTLLGIMAAVDGHGVGDVV